jgi:putative transposase
VYLVAVMDWFSRYVLSWAMTITMDVAFCVEALEQAIRHGQPEIFNTDQGAQFTSLTFTDQSLARYFGFYNEVRLHQALGYRTPAAVYLP